MTVSLLIAFSTFVITIRLIANGRLKPLVICEPIIQGGKSLVVLVHGTQRTARTYFNCMRSILEQAHPDADILPIQYPSHNLSNADPFLISEQICQKIQEAYHQKNYDTIILVGYSKGALMIRKALVYGHGRIEDLESVGGESRDLMPWVNSVERLPGLVAAYASTCRARRVSVEPPRHR